MAKAEFLGIVAPAPFMWYHNGYGLFRANVRVGRIIEPGTLIGHIHSEKAVEGVYYVGTRRARVIELVANGKEADVSKPLGRLKLLGPSKAIRAVRTRRKGNPGWSTGSSPMVSLRQRTSVGDTIYTGQVVGKLTYLDTEGQNPFPTKPIRYYGPTAKVIWLINSHYSEVEAGTVIMLVRPTNK